MRYVVYHKETTRYLRNHPKVRTDHTSFASAPAARAALTREVNRGAVKREDFAVAESFVFHAEIEKKETVKSLMNPNGPDIIQSVNTPLICDPSSETYWSA
jgi:hypothetical protein